MARGAQPRHAAVLAAIADTEQLDNAECDNDYIVEVTGMRPRVVAEILSQLWSKQQIEGIETLRSRSARAVSLRGIRRVLPGRPRLLGAAGIRRAHAQEDPATPQHLQRMDS
jgi:hypothetical protein